MLYSWLLFTHVILYHSSPTCKYFAFNRRTCSHVCILTMEPQLLRKCQGWQPLVYSLYHCLFVEFPVFAQNVVFLSSQWTKALKDPQSTKNDRKTTQKDPKRIQNKSKKAQKHSKNNHNTQKKKGKNTKTDPSDAMSPRYWWDAQWRWAKLHANRLGCREVSEVEEEKEVDADVCLMFFWILCWVDFI